jgi:hypothetical protein
MNLRSVAVLALVLAACSEELPPNCGDSLRCGSSEFCLVILPAEGDYGDQSYSCKPLPQGCADFDAMCTDDPPCGEDWATLYCDPSPLSVGCTTFGEAQEAVCEQ